MPFNSSSNSLWKRKNVIDGGQNIKQNDETNYKLLEGVKQRSKISNSAERIIKQKVPLSQLNQNTFSTIGGRSVSSANHLIYSSNCCS